MKRFIAVNIKLILLIIILTIFAAPYLLRLDVAYLLTQIGLSDKVVSFYEIKIMPLLGLASTATLGVSVLNVTLNLIKRSKTTVETIVMTADSLTASQMITTHNNSQISHVNLTAMLQLVELLEPVINPRNYTTGEQYQKLITLKKYLKDNIDINADALLPEKVQLQKLKEYRETCSSSLKETVIPSIKEMLNFNVNTLTQQIELLEKQIVEKLGVPIETNVTSNS